MIFRAVIGVDPGVQGGVVTLDARGRVVFIHGFRPTQPEGMMMEALRAAAVALGAAGGYEAYVEQVGYIRGDGGKGSFTFGRIYGFKRGILLTNGVTLRNVRPAVWQSSLGCLTGGDKKVTLAKARALFPDVAADLSTADALLIAEYGRRLSAFTSNPTC